MMMLRLDEKALTLIGRYIVLSIYIAAILMLTATAVPLWCAFPLATIWMITGGTAVDGDDEKGPR